MGAVQSLLSNLDSNDPKAQQMQDAARALHREIQQENEKFIQDTIESNNEIQKLLPITAMLRMRSYVDQREVDDMSQMGQKILDLVNGVLSGSSSVSTAVTQALTTAATALLENTCMSYKKEVGYTISVGLLGGVQRLDYMVVTRSFTSKSFKTIMKTTISGVMILSAVDTSKLKRNDASVLVQNCFKQSSAQVQSAIRKLILIEMNKNTSEQQKREKSVAIYQTLPPLLKASYKQWLEDQTKLHPIQTTSQAVEGKNSPTTTTTTTKTNVQNTSSPQSPVSQEQLGGQSLSDIEIRVNSLAQSYNQLGDTKYQLKANYLKEIQKLDPNHRLVRDIDIKYFKSHKDQLYLQLINK